MGRFFVCSHDMVVAVELVLPFFVSHEYLFSNVSCRSVAGQTVGAVRRQAMCMGMMLLCETISDNEELRVGRHWKR